MNSKDTKFTWVAILFLVTIFFSTGHDVLFTVSRVESINPTIDEIVSRGDYSGDIQRPVSFVLLGFFGVAGLLYRKGKIFTMNGLLSWLVIIFSIFTFFSIAWSQSLIQTLKSIVNLFMFGCGALYVVKFFSLRHIVIWIFITTGIYLLIGFFAETFLGTFHPLTSAYRFAGTCGPNLQGWNCGLFILSSIAMLRFVNRGRILLKLCPILGFIFLFFTGSRTSLVCTMIAILLYSIFIFLTMHRFIIIFCAIGIILTASLLVMDLNISDVQEGTSIFRTEDSSQFTLTGRVPIWNECLSNMESHLFCGYGFNGFWTPQRINNISTKLGWPLGDSHSAYVEILLGLGLFGMICFVLILIIGIRQSIFYYRSSKDSIYIFFLALLIFCFFHGLLETAIIGPSLLRFILMVVLLQLGFTKTNTLQTELKNKPGFAL